MQEEPLNKAHLEKRLGKICKFGRLEIEKHTNSLIPAVVHIICLFFQSLSLSQFILNSSILQHACIHAVACIAIARPMMLCISLVICVCVSVFVNDPCALILFSCELCRYSPASSSAPILLTSVNCYSSFRYSTLNSCDHSSATSNCTHAQDVAISCYSKL